MPELIEVEQYRACLDGLVGLPVRSVAVTDERFLRRGTPDDLDRIVGLSLAATDRVGKLLLATFRGDASEATLGLRFGMTGRLLVDGTGPIDQLEYASKRNELSWDRFRLDLGRRIVTIRDQRLLGSVELDPDTSGLGPEASTITQNALAARLNSRSAIKTLLLDQSRIAGLGNLLVDEVLWRSAIDPTRAGNELDPRSIGILAGTIVDTVSELSSRGGSHRGDTFPLRHLDAVCTRCSGAMQYAKLAGRGTWWCSHHQTLP